MKNGRIIPPLSIVKLERSDANTPAWKKQVGREFRIGYYCKHCGVDCVWLVNEEGTYEQTTDQSSLHEYFEVVELSHERSLYGRNKSPIPPLRAIRKSARPRSAIHA